MHVWLVVLNGLQSILGNFVLTVVVTLSGWEHSNFHTGILIGDYRARMTRSYSWSLRWRMVLDVFVPRRRDQLYVRTYVYRVDFM